METIVIKEGDNGRVDKIISAAVDSIVLLEVEAAEWIGRRDKIEGRKVEGNEGEDWGTERSIGKEKKWIAG